MLALSHHQIVAKLIDADLSYGDQICFLVTSNSMHPLLNIGDSVTAEVIAGEKVQRGDLIVIKRSNNFVTHRAILPMIGSWLTKGDNNTLPDPLISMNSIIARIITIQKPNHTINLETRNWRFFNQMMAKLGALEIKKTPYHRYIQLPIRFLNKLILSLSVLNIEWW